MGGGEEWGLGGGGLGDEPEIHRLYQAHYAFVFCPTESECLEFMTSSQTEYLFLSKVDSHGERGGGGGGGSFL